MKFTALVALAGLTLATESHVPEAFLACIQGCNNALFMSSKNCERACVAKYRIREEEDQLQELKGKKDRFCKFLAKKQCTSTKHIRQCIKKKLVACHKMIADPCVKEVANQCHGVEEPKECFWGKVKACKPQNKQDKLDDQLFVI